MSIPNRITGIAEIVLNVMDLSKMREFYTRVLGFQLHSEVSMERETVDPNGDPTISFLTICDGDSPLAQGGHPPMLVLIDYRRHVFARRRVLGHDATRSTLNHLAFEISPGSLEQHADRLAQFDIDIAFSEFPDLQAHALFFQDPEGNTLELICHQPPVE